MHTMKAYWWNKAEVFKCGLRKPMAQQRLPRGPRDYLYYITALWRARGDAVG